MRALFAAALFSIATLSAQQASYTYIYQSTRGCGGNPNPPWLTAMNLPRIGTTFRVSIPFGSHFTAPRPCPPTTGAKTFTLCTGATNPNVLICWPLPPYYVGTIFTSAEVSFVSPWGSPGQYTTVDFPIPNNPALVGASFYQQVYYMSFYWCHGAPFIERGLGRGGHGITGT